MELDGRADRSPLHRARAAVTLHAPLRRRRRPVLLWGDGGRHPNLRWRSGFRAPDPYCVIDEGGGRTTLWVNEMEHHRASIEAQVTSVRDMSALTLPRRPGLLRETRVLLAILREHGIDAVDVDGEDFPVLVADQLRREGIDVRPRAGLYRNRRRTKTRDELAAIVETQNAGAEAVRAALAVIRTAEVRDGLLWRDGRPLTGDDLTLSVETRLLELGCTAEDSITCGAPENADPHRLTSPVLRAGLPIVLDIYPVSKRTRYWGDMTRTVVRGTPDPEVRRMYDAVLAAQLAALEMVRPGADARAIHLRVCEVLAEHGYGSSTPPYDTIASAARFIHGTGHGVGLDIHEAPSLGRRGHSLLREGDVITIEPGLYHPALGGVRIEDLVVVTRDGYRQLTPLSKRLELG